MYTKITKYIKEHLQQTIDANKGGVQVDYLGNISLLNFGKPAILLEPRKDSKEPRSTRWKSSQWQIRIWVMAEIIRDYMLTMEQVESLIGAEDADGQEKVGLMASLDQLKRDAGFQALSGSFGGKGWRINSGNPLDYSDVNWAITQRGSSAINAAQVEVTIYFQQEK